MSRTVFLGTPPAAIPTLRALHEVTDVVAVITRPDAPQGRSRTPVRSPVGQAAEELGLTVLTPASRSELESGLRAHPVDFGVVVAYGHILSAEALASPRLGLVNVHFSLLPRWRGAAPVERAVLAGDTQTGVTLMQMDEGLDTGAVIADWATSIGTDESAGELTERLAVGGAELLATHVTSIGGSTSPQSEDGVTYAAKLTTDEARIDWAAGASSIANAIRAFEPRPGAHTTWRGERFKIARARRRSEVLPAGDLGGDDARILVGTGDGSVELLTVQPAGSARMDALAWARGVQGEFGTMV